MYLAAIVLLMLALPVGSVILEATFAHGAAAMPELIGKWFVFWSVGVRLLLAGARQIANPAFTAETILGVKDKGALTIVRELGFGNLSIGFIGALSLAEPAWVIPAAVAGGLFYGLAGVNHLVEGGWSPLKTIAMVSDLFIFAVLSVDLIFQLA